MPQDPLVELMREEVSFWIGDAGRPPRTDEPAGESCWEITQDQQPSLDATTLLAWTIILAVCAVCWWAVISSVGSYL
jgi:hypothetical protein